MENLRRPVPGRKKTPRVARPMGLTQEHFRASGGRKMGRDGKRLGKYGESAMQVARLCIYFIALVAALTPDAFPVCSAQTLEPELRPDLRRALSARPQAFDMLG